jgi:hypothetical protein
MPIIATSLRHGSLQQQVDDACGMKLSYCSDPEIRDVWENAISLDISISEACDSMVQPSKPLDDTTTSCLPATVLLPQNASNTSHPRKGRPNSSLSGVQQFNSRAGFAGRVGLQRVILLWAALSTAFLSQQVVGTLTKVPQYYCSSAGPNSCPFCSYQTSPNACNVSHLIISFPYDIPLIKECHA